MRGAIVTRTFIPHRCHASIGVFGALGALSVATACLLLHSPAHALSMIPGGSRKALRKIRDAAVVRTARKLFDGRVFPS
jgi:4-oxalomesaconate tautomerase